ncbi:MAG: Rpn family recombination-promoting nuclease/putative transposase [Verrucomicrobiales bacterium]
MPEDDIHHPNDKLFRTTFGVPENAAALLKAKLPAAVAVRVDWDRLRLLPGSFVDSQFRASHADLLFEAPMAGHDALIYVLFELQRIVLYILAADIDMEAFNAKIRQLSNPETRAAAMTLAEKLRQEGRQEALQHAVLAVLLTRFQNVPSGLQEALRAVQGEDPLQALHRAAIECPSLEAFAERL